MLNMFCFREEADASVARRLAEELEKEEEEQRRMNQFRDERVAKRMQVLLLLFMGFLSLLVTNIVV